MSSHDPIAYTYEADYHCPADTERRFGRSEAGFIAEEAEDNEGNPVGAVFPWDEWCQSDGECETLVCSDCGAELDTAHADPHSESCPEFEAVFTFGETPRAVIERRLPLKYEMSLNVSDMVNLLSCLKLVRENTDENSGDGDWASEFRSSILLTLGIEEV